MRSCRGLAGALAALGLSACASAPRALTALSVENASRQKPLIVDEPIVVKVSLRGPLPVEELRWTLMLGGRHKASGGIERFAGDVPRREFEIQTVIDHKDFGGVGRPPVFPAASPSPRRDFPPPPLSQPIRAVRFELTVVARDGRTVAKASRDAQVTCASDDRHSSCW